MAAKHSKRAVRDKKKRAEDYLFEDYIKSLDEQKEQQSTEDLNENNDKGAIEQAFDKINEDIDIGELDIIIKTEEAEKADKPSEANTEDNEENKTENYEEENINNKSDDTDENVEADIDKIGELINEPEKEDNSWEKVKPPKSKKSGAIGCFALLIAAAAIGVGAYAGVGYVYYKDVFRAGTVINGIDCSYKSANEVKELLNQKAESYKLDIYNGDKLIDSFSGKSIDLAFEDTDIESIAKGQNKLYWAKKYLLDRDSEIVISQSVSYDKEKLDKLISTCKVTSLKPSRTNEQPKVEYDGKQFIVTDGVQGDEIDAELFKERMYEYIAEGKGKMVLQEADVYKKLAKGDTSDLENKAAEANKLYSGISLSVMLGNTGKDIGKDIVTKAVVINDNNAVTCNAATIKNAIADIKAQYSTAGIERNFLTSHGGYTKVKGGDYGLAVNMYGVQAKAVDAIMNKKPVSITVPYANDTLDKQGNGLDIGDTYIEIDLTNQYCYVYVDGVKKYETPVVTGLPGARATPQGVYMLKNKVMNVPLVGDNYVTPVKYWMPFNGGIGLHDAVWQSAFGGDRYRTKGSHGCVNLSMDSATNIYSFAKVGMPVVCYYYDRISSFKQVKSPNAVMGTFRALTAKERNMLANLKKGKKVNGAVYNSNAGANAKKYGSVAANAGTALENSSTNTIDPTAVDVEPLPEDIVTTPAGM